MFGAKQETSTSEPFRPWKGSNFLYAEGWITATIHGVSYASGWVNPYDFITWVRDPNVGNHSSITVTGTHFFGNAPKVLFYDQDKNWEYAFEGNAWQNAMQAWTWHEVQGLRTDWKTIQPVTRTGPKGRLQHVGQDGAASWATAQIYDPTGGTVTPTATAYPVHVYNRGVGTMRERHADAHCDRIACRMHGNATAIFAALHGRSTTATTTANCRGTSVEPIGCCRRCERQRPTEPCHSRRIQGTVGSDARSGHEPRDEPQHRDHGVQHRAQQDCHHIGQGLGAVLHRSHKGKRG